MTHMLECAEEWYNAIKSGKKIAEGRVGKEKILKMKNGDTLIITNSNDSSAEEVVKIIKDIARYESFKEMLEKEGLNNVLPGKANIVDGINVYRQWYSEENEKYLGVYAIKF